MKKCPYCGSKKLDSLTETVYCDACQSYFRRTKDELVPIFIENKEVYRKYQKISERRVLCTVCQERNEMEIEKLRAEEEQREKLKRPMKKDKSDLIFSNLCRECVERVNAKLESDRVKYYPEYRSFIIRKRVVGSAVIAVTAVISNWTGGLFGSFVLAAYMIREIRGLESVFISILFCSLAYFFSWVVFVFSVVVLMWLFARRKCKELIYLQFSLDVEKIQKDILRKIKSLHLGDKRDTQETAPQDRRSFVHLAYSQHQRHNEELDEIAKGISSLKIKDTWYGKVDRIVEWLATT
ncbi:uncharacterized protein NESG_00342 [Nematocida ausubeli]|uniref:Uncharacterized protein n=1 Tax=Nematocida ausubeli (strain ATCC PRA-371 / ERTm2) TaxID=1913371 RepID=A0A086J546_NEMA1|nr:uncharacterized protein NESG_00342 [Nematocida ausubeli]KFG27264.1 hypothetical protein NESG_00342 [Nematocida ausubeli]